MKRGYKKLLIFEIFVFLFLILNLFVFKYLSGFKMSIFLLILLVIFKFLFGFERDNHRYIKDFIMEEIIFLIVFLIIYYLSGILFSFAKTNYLNYNGLIRFILPTTIYILLREYFRYMILCKSGNNKLVSIVAIILIFIMDISGSFYYNSLSTGLSGFIYITTFVLPALCNNIIFSYITKKIGYKPVILYSLVVGLYPYVLPLIPNPNQYIQSIVLFLLPVLFGYKAHKFFVKTKNVEYERDYYKKAHSLKSLAVVSIVTVIMVYFISGYFSYWAVVIASGSMSKQINKGDIAIIHKVNKNFDKLEVGQVLAYEYQGKVVIHRIVEKININGEYYFYTKGDANRDIDNIIIEEDMIVGVVKHKIPYLGLPTVWLNEL